MPKGKIPRYKVIRCRLQGCRRIIHRFDRAKYPGYHVPARRILSVIRRHYKEHHPAEFREMIRRGVEARKAKRAKKGKRTRKTRSTRR